MLDGAAAYLRTPVPPGLRRGVRQLVDQVVAAALPRPDHRSSHTTHHDIRIHLEAGLHEGPSAALPVDALHSGLAEHGVTVSRTDFNGAHDYACWRGGLADVLVSLLGR